jgi:hypothetical protein
MEAEQAALLSAIGQASTSDPAAVPAGAANRLAGLAWRLAGAVTGFFWLRGCRDDYRGACDLALIGARRAGARRGAAWMLAALAWVAVDQCQGSRTGGRSLHRYPGAVSSGDSRRSFAVAAPATKSRIG